MAWLEVGSRGTSGYPSRPSTRVAGTYGPGQVPETGKRRWDLKRHRFLLRRRRKGMDVMEFRDRSAAGRLLAEGLTDLRGNDVVVLGVATGGVVVAAKVATALGVPLDVLVVRKVGVPWQPELAMGAVGEDGASLVDPVVVHAPGVEPDELAEAQNQARTQLAREVAVLREVWAPVGLRGRTTVVVDDGMATGTTASTPRSSTSGTRNIRV
jgi:adenine/guanine phosphoribosyltransferase-like PRPP-binding protein